MSNLIETSEGQQYTIIAAETGPSPWQSATKFVEMTVRAAGFRESDLLVFCKLAN